MKTNYRFNRKEKKGVHRYIDVFNPPKTTGLLTYEGYIKCKLVHGVHGSLVVPDQIYLSLGAELVWMQPLYFSGNYISFSDPNSVCTLPVDVSVGARLFVKFQNNWIINRLSDGSCLYRCSIQGPSLLHRHATGECKLVDNTPYIKLFHHTNLRAKESILESSLFRTSSWNIQGTKKLTNIGYLYLTPLDKIACNQDLQEIAMSSKGIIPLRLDGNLGNNPDLLLRVYRESTTNRQHAIHVWVKAEHLSPQHIYRHSGYPYKFVYHQVVCPFIHRIGTHPGEGVMLTGGTVRPCSSKQFEYVVLGDASCKDGLLAPYDEEDTSQIYKIDRMSEGDEIISYWRINQNSDLYSQLSIDLGEFAEQPAA